MIAVLLSYDDTIVINFIYFIHQLFISIYHYIYLSIHPLYLLIDMSIQSIYLSIHHSIYPPLSLSIYLSIYPSIYLLYLSTIIRADNKVKSERKLYEEKLREIASLAEKYGRLEMEQNKLMQSLSKWG